MRPTILIVAAQSPTLLGLAHATLKFGFQLVTAYPEPAELDRFEDAHPSVVLVRPPGEPDARERCLGIVRARFHDRGVPVLACLATPEEEGAVKEALPRAATLVGSPLRLNELYRSMQGLMDLGRRKELRIRTDLVVAHREPGLYQDDFYFYDTMTSLSSGGCFIRTANAYPVGTRIEMLFCVGSGSRCLRLRGEVRRHASGGSGEEEGMGVQFETLPDDSRRILDAYLVSQIGTADLPSTL